MRNQGVFHIEVFLAEFKKRFMECGYTSYRKLAAAMDVDIATVINIVTYHRRPTALTVKKLAKAFNEPELKWLELAGYEPVKPIYALQAERKLSDEAVKRIEELIAEIQEEEDNE